MSRPTPRCARWSPRRPSASRTLGAHVEDVGPLIEPLQNSFEPLWIGSFATRLRQIPTQLHGKLDPGFRAAAEKGLVVTLADYARSYEARSKLARDMALWHRNYDLLLAPVTPTAAPPVETLYNSDAFPRWTKGAPFTLPFNLTGQPAASMPAGLTEAGLPVGLQIDRPAARRPSRAAGDARLRKRGRLDLAAAEGAGDAGEAVTPRGCELGSGAVQPECPCNQQQGGNYMQRNFKVGRFAVATAIVLAVRQREPRRRSSRRRNFPT